jgi:hypothetical protein
VASRRVAETLGPASPLALGELDHQLAVQPG